MAIEEYLITLDKVDAWKEALQDVPHGYWHSWEACSALQLSHGAPAFLYCLKDRVSGHKAVCVYSERQWQDSVDIFSAAGFSGFVSSGPVHGLRQYWQNFVRARGYVCGYFSLHPVVATQSAYDRIFTNNNLYILDASIGASELIDNADNNVKRSWRKWVAGGQQFVEDRELLTDFVLRHYRVFMQHKNASSAVLWTDETLKMICADPAVLLVGGRDELGLCVVGAFATSPYAADYLFNVNLRTGRQYTAPIIFWGVQQLEKRGIRWLNLGGGVRAGDSIAKAKERYRPQCRPFYNAKEVYNQQRYEQLCMLAGRNAEDLEGFFPPYRLADDKA